MKGRATGGFVVLVVLAGVLALARGRIMLQSSDEVDCRSFACFKFFSITHGGFLGEQESAMFALTAFAREK